MARTVLTPIDVPSGYAAAGVAVTFTAWDSGNGNRFLCTGKEILLVKNAHATLAQTVTIHSQPDDKGRSGDITAESIAATGVVHVFQQFPRDGWADANGYVNVDGSTTDIQFAVLRLPG